MEITCLKLSAKRKMLKNNFRFFIVSALPFFTISLLIILNYYFIEFFKKTDLRLTGFLLPYTEAVRLSLILFLILFSLCLWKGISLCSQMYFYKRAKGNKNSFFNCMKSLSFSQYNSFLGVTIIKALLSLGIGALYFLPGIAVSVLLIYSYRYESYGFNVNLTLFVSVVILFVIGAVFFFITTKRYSLSTYILLTENERNPLKIIARSIEIMGNHSVEYSLYCLSFLGWILSCVFIIPIIYTVPYIILSKWNYINFIENNNQKEITLQKPIVFYIQKRVKSWKNLLRCLWQK